MKNKLKYSKLKTKRFSLLISRLFAPVLEIVNLKAMPRYVSFFAEWIKFRSIGGEAQILDLYPCLFDRSSVTSIDKHYFYQAIWGLKKVVASGASEHVDVGSDVRYVGMLTAVIEVVFVDIRPLNLEFEGFKEKKGSILALPFDDCSVSSLSCLSVAEHIGLGRYGDVIDPAGTIMACAELSRILALGGNLYLGLPVGRRRVCFNAHRIHRASEILDFFPDLTLQEFSVVDDNGNFLVDTNPMDFDDAEFANGLYHFIR